MNEMTRVDGWSRGRELNPRPTDYESVALPLSYPGVGGASDLAESTIAPALAAHVDTVGSRAVGCEWRISRMAKVAAIGFVVFALSVAAASAQTTQCPDGRWYASGTCTRCPDGQWTTAPACQRTPSGDWIPDYGKGLRRSPDGQWIPDGAGVVQCPDGRWYAGAQCVFLPSQRWTGAPEAPSR